MRALESITGHVIIKLRYNYNQIYQLKTSIVNCYSDREKPVENLRLKARTIYLNSDISDQFLKQNTF